MRERSPWYRNDERLRGLGDLFKSLGQNDFVHVETVEYNGDAPLGWSMSDAQRLDLIRAGQNQVNDLIGRFRQSIYPWL